jgi:hypothetical protein
MLLLSGGAGRIAGLIAVECVALPADGVRAAQTKGNGTLPNVSGNALFEQVHFGEYRC